MITTKAASLSCLGFIFGMCWLISQVATPLSELCTPLVVRDGGAEAPAVADRFSRSTPTAADIRGAPEQDVVYAAALPAVVSRTGTLPSPVNDGEAPVIVDLDAAVQEDMPRLAMEDSGTPGRAVPEAVVVERPVGGLHLLAALTPPRPDVEAASAPAEPAPERRTFEYTVKTGDSLGKIARRFGSAGATDFIGAIVAANPQIEERQDRIFVGEVLAIPAATDSPASARAPEAAPVAAEPRDYTVRPGDSLVAIARRLLRDENRWREIAVLNELTNADKIIPGKRILLPPVRSDT